MVGSIMEPEGIDAEFAEARAAYFRRADEVLEKIRLQYGEGLDGLRHLLNRQPKYVDNSSEYDDGKD